MGSSTEKLKMIVSVKDQASSKLKNIAGSVLSIGAAYLSIQKLGAAYTAVVDKATESEKVWNDTAASLERHALAIGQNFEAVVAFSESMQAMTGISDEVIDGFFQCIS